MMQPLTAGARDAIMEGLENQAFRGGGANAGDDEDSRANAAEREAAMNAPTANADALSFSSFCETLERVVKLRVKKNLRDAKLNLLFPTQLYKLLNRHR